MRSLDDIDGIRDEFAQTGIVANVAVPDIPPCELWAKLQTHRRLDHWATLVETVLASPSITPAFIEIVATETDDPNILNAVVTSGSAPEPVLERLAAHPACLSIREHAFIGLIRKRFPRLHFDDFESLVQTYSGDFGVAPGVRHILASSQHTPALILERLAEDDVDFVRRAAVATLATRISHSE